MHRCVRTREFKRLRGLVMMSELCPREGCRGLENVENVFWHCKYARYVEGG